MDSGPQEPQKANRNPVITGIIAVAVLVIVIGAITVFGNKDKSSDDASNTSSSSSANGTAASNAAPSDAPAATTGAYKSGTYSADATYTSPGGTEEVHVTVTLDGNTIKTAEVTTDPASGTSTEYQGDFKSGFKNLVVGKNIDDVKLSKVSGSSLTSQGFNAAIAKIKAQAKSA